MSSTPPSLIVLPLSVPLAKIAAAAAGFDQVAARRAGTMDELVTAADDRAAGRPVILDVLRAATADQAATVDRASEVDVLGAPLMDRAADGQAAGIVQEASAAHQRPAGRGACDQGSACRAPWCPRRRTVVDGLVAAAVDPDAGRAATAVHVLGGHVADHGIFGEATVLDGLAASAQHRSGDVMATGQDLRAAGTDRGCALDAAAEDSRDAVSTIVALTAVPSTMFCAPPLTSARLTVPPLYTFCVPPLPIVLPLSWPPAGMMPPLWIRWPRQWQARSAVAARRTCTAAAR